MSITVYSRPRCVQSVATGKVLRAKKAHFEIVDITLDKSAAREVQSLGRRWLTVVSTGSQHWSGFTPDEIGTL